MRRGLEQIIRRDWNVRDVVEKKSQTAFHFKPLESNEALTVKHRSIISTSGGYWSIKNGRLVFRFVQVSQDSWISAKRTDMIPAREPS